MQRSLTNLSVRGYIALVRELYKWYITCDVSLLICMLQQFVNNLGIGGSFKASIVGGGGHQH